MEKEIKQGEYLLNHKAFDDKKEGKAIFYHTDGDKVEYTYIDGELQGKYIYTFADGKVAISYFVDGFDLDDPIKREEKEDGKVIFSWSKKDFLECTLVDGVPQGEAVIKKSEDEWEEVILVEGIKQGKAKHITRLTEEEYNYVDGIKQGKAKLIDQFGIIREFNYVNGVKKGEGVTTLRNGDKIVCDYVNEIQQGKCKYIYVNGKTIDSWYIDGLVLDLADRKEVDEDGETTFYFGEYDTLKCTLVNGVPQGEAVSKKFCGRLFFNTIHWIGKDMVLIDGVNCNSDSDSYLTIH